MIYAESSTLRTDGMGVLQCSIIYSVNMQYNIKGFAAGSQLRGGVADTLEKSKSGD